MEQEQVRVAGEEGGDSDSRASRQPAARPGQSSVQSTALWLSAPGGGGGDEQGYEEKEKEEEVEEEEEERKGDRPPYCAEGRHQLLATRHPTWTHLHQPGA